MQLQRTLAAAPSTTRGRGLLLSGHGDTLVWTNAKNVLLFNVKTRAVETFNEHTAACTAARFTAGGDHVASGDASGCVRVWNVATKKCVAQVPALSGAVNDVFVDRDLKTLYVCGEGRGRLAGAFEAENGNALGNLTGLTRPGNALDVSGDGLRVATGDDAGGCFAHDAAAPFKQRFCVQDQGGRAVNCVRFAPGSSTFCSVGGSKALLYSGDGVAPTALAGHTGSIYCVSFAPGGGQLVTVRATVSVLRPTPHCARAIAGWSGQNSAAVRHKLSACGDHFLCWRSAGRHAGGLLLARCRHRCQRCAQRRCSSVRPAHGCVPHARHRPPALRDGDGGA
jgi:WD40 repeat protein